MVSGVVVFYDNKINCYLYCYLVLSLFFVFIFYPLVLLLFKVGLLYLENFLVLYWFFLVSLLLLPCLGCLGLDM